MSNTTITITTIDAAGDIVNQVHGASIARAKELFTWSQKRDGAPQEIAEECTAIAFSQMIDEECGCCEYYIAHEDTILMLETVNA